MIHPLVVFVVLYGSFMLVVGGLIYVAFRNQ